MKFNDVAVSMITRNEEKAIRKVIRDIKKYLPGAEIIIVDGSDDKTPAIAKSLGVQVIRQFPPKGFGTALKKALLTPEREIIVTLDCDDTYPVEDAPLLIEKIRDGYDVVGTTRIDKNGKPKHMPWPNYLANKLFNVVASCIFLRRIQDVHSGMRAYKRSVLHLIPWGKSGHLLPGLNMVPSGEKGFALPVELLLKPISHGYKVTEVPIDYRERVGVTKLEKLSSVVWTFLRILNSRFKNKKSVLFTGIVSIILLLLFFFHFNNLYKYSYLWGFDAAAHTQFIEHINTQKKLPADKNYASSNPPLYYLTASWIYTYFPNMKVLQLFSFLLYILDIILLHKSLQLVSKNTFLNSSILIFFSLLPVSLIFSYMIFNYPLGNFFAIVTFYLFLKSIQSKVMTNRFIIQAAIFSSLALLSSLNNLALILTSALSILLFPHYSLGKKMKSFILYGSLVMLILSPYILFKINTYNCFFCTFNKEKTELKPFNIYPSNFFVSFDPLELKEPFFQLGDMENSMWTVLHETLYTDYYNYLVTEKYTHNDYMEKNYVSTSWHYLDQRKILPSIIMNYLGIPISAFLFFVVYKSITGAVTFIMGNKKYFIDTFIAIIIVSFCSQFFIYLVTYPGFTDLSVGYLYSCLFIMCLGLAHYYSKSRRFALILSVLLAIYSLASYYTYFML
jgi:hypothetical protein